MEWNDNQEREQKIPPAHTTSYQAYILRRGMAGGWTTRAAHNAGPPSRTSPQSRTLIGCNDCFPNFCGCAATVQQRLSLDTDNADGEYTQLVRVVSTMRWLNTEFLIIYYRTRQPQESVEQMTTLLRVHLPYYCTYGNTCIKHDG